MPAKKLGVSLPCQAVPTRSSIQPLLPDPHDAPIELQKALGVRRSPIVLVVASEFGVEGFPLLIHRGMSVLLTPFGDRREAPAEPLAHRSHMHCELPSPAAGADVRKAKKIEGVGLRRS